MNSTKNSVPAFDCLRVARKDWMSIHPMLEEANAEAAGYFLQQSLEKYLMAFLLQNGWKLRTIHELDLLLDDAVKYRSDLKIFQDLCKRVSAYYIADGNSAATLELTCENIIKDIREAEGFVKMMFSKKGQPAKKQTTIP
ncbi:MAG TPA: HEPN domain-containing protein [Thermodesulfobacteriota bacterium]|nr:HEPN domain-containing protein [Thermodesulfobacteriota bacterium]